jgi:hypothetical protein
MFRLILFLKRPRQPSARLPYIKTGKTPKVPIPQATFFRKYSGRVKIREIRKQENVKQLPNYPLATNHRPLTTEL